MSPPETSPLLELRGVRKVFEADLAPVRALRGIDFEVRRGEFIAVMGPSGCGKSTMLSIIAGLDTPDDGEVVLDGSRVDAMTEDERALVRREQIGIVFQFFHLLDGLTALENVALPGITAGNPRRRARSRARDLLDLLGLADKADQMPWMLSGGQRQRLAIARALANEPVLLLADEPTGALDSDGGHEILELFTRLHRDGQTILMVTHDRVVADAADAVARMRDGNIEHDGRATSDVSSTRPDA